MQRLSNDLPPCLRIAPQLTFDDRQPAMLIYEDGVNRSGFRAKLFTERNEPTESRINIICRNAIWILEECIAKPRFILIFQLTDVNSLALDQFS